jgi:hypothetical protein
MRTATRSGDVSDLPLALVDLLALAIIVWVFQLVRRDRLYVGFGVIFVVVVALGGSVVTFPGALAPFVAFSRLAARSPLVIGLALVFMLLMLIYILSQTTLLSNRVARLTQEIAIREAMSQQGPRNREDHAS